METWIIVALGVVCAGLAAALAVQQRRAARGRFERLAQDIFERHVARLNDQNQVMRDQLREQSEALRTQSRDSVEGLLKPFRENITEFRERVERIHSTQAEQQGALRNELRNLMELNRRITAETTNLTAALRGSSKTQGDWGEMILETILDGSRLVKGIHYHTQPVLKGADGQTLRPDVVLHLPEGKRIVIDSKVSLTAFTEYCAASGAAGAAGSPEGGGASASAVRAALAAHVASVRSHVTELGRKEYQRLVESPDFVIMFVPNEPAFLAAMQADSSIWADAYDKKVIVSSPTNLFALLKLVDDLWQRDARTKNTAEIVTYGTKLYEQMVAFTASLEGVGAALGTARERYDDAFKRLTSGNDNIVRTGERLRKLGLPTTRRHTSKTLREAEGAEEE